VGVVVQQRARAHKRVKLRAALGVQRLGGGGFGGVGEGWARGFGAGGEVGARLGWGLPTRLGWGDSLHIPTSPKL
jgi:hypothetical protein